MITFNFSHALGSIGAAGTYTKTDGTTVSLSAYGSDVIKCAWNLSNTIPAPSQYSYIALGTGSTAPSRDDINLVAPVTDSDFTVSASSKTLSADQKTILNQTYQYNGVNEVVIAELGLIASVNYLGVGQPILMARVVLDSPVSVNNGDIFTVSMTIG